MAYSINENHLHIVTTNYVEGPTRDKLLFDVANKVLYFLIRCISGADTGFPGDISTCSLLYARKESDCNSL